MARRAFTLIELLAIVALLGVMVSIAVVSIQAGTDAARLKGSVRDVFATVRLARSIALVTQKPCVITFSTTKKNDVYMSKAEIVSSRLMTSTPTTRARSVTGEWITLGAEEEAPDDSRQAFVVENRDDGETKEQGGETVEEVLFAPVSEEVFRDICIKVVMEDEEIEGAGADGVNEAKRSMISTFSNVDFLLGKYKEERLKRQEEAAKNGAEEGGAAAMTAAAAAKSSAQAQTGLMDDTGERSVVWQVNGRCEPHTIYVYSNGDDFLTEGWQIKVDRFGAAKTLAPGENE